MELTRLIAALSNPAAYSFPVDTVEVRHTHISVVFLAGRYVYKIKKPLDLGFLDFTTLEKRRHFCEEEVRLNRRLAPKVYLGVVSVTRTGTQLEMEGQGEVVEWAVKMERLPQEATLQEQLQRGEVGSTMMVALADRIADFHARAESGAHVSAFGRFDVVARNARENFEQSTPQVGITLSHAVFDRLRVLTEQALVRLRPLIEARAVRGVPRDTHGDLHLDHVYLLPAGDPSAGGEKGVRHLLPERPGGCFAHKVPDPFFAADLAIIDCIEFNERFRYADPVSDLAFLVMDLLFHGRRDLAEPLAEAYFQASEDQEGADLLDYYTAYRAAVRAKVEGFKLAEKEIPQAERMAAVAQARAHWLLALRTLEEPSRKPCLLLIGGLPGTGKSTLARSLVERTNFCLIRSDVVRKELAGVSTPAHPTNFLPAGGEKGVRHLLCEAPSGPFRQKVPDPFFSAGEKRDPGDGFGQGIYSPIRTERTYADCLRRAERLLFKGQRVIVDASFSQEKWRRAFLDSAARLAVPALFLLCQASPEAVEQRLEKRVGDASDANMAIYQKAAERWEEVGPATRPVLREVTTNGKRDASLSLVILLLHEMGLMRCESPENPPSPLEVMSTS